MHNKLNLYFIVGLFIISIALVFGIVSSLFLAQQSFIVADYGLEYDFIGVLLLLQQVGWLGGALIIYLIGRYVPNIHFITISLIGSFVILLFFAIMDKSILTTFGYLVFLFLGICMGFCWTPMTDVVSKYISEKNRVNAILLITSGSCWGILLVGYLVSISTPEQWQYLFEIVTIMGGIVLGIFVIYFYLFNRETLSIKTPPPMKIKSSATKSADKFIIMVYITHFMIGFSYMSFNSYYSVYLDEELSLTSNIIGNSWLINGFVGLSSAIILGKITNKFGYKFGINTAYIFLFLAVLSLIFGAINPVYFAYASIICFALSYYPIYGMFPSYLSTIFKSGITKILALANFISGIGAGVGSYMGGLIKHETGSLITLYIVLLVMVSTMILLITTTKPNNKPS